MKKKLKPEYDGIIFDSEEEVDFYCWCHELKNVGIIQSFEYAPDPIALFDGAKIQVKKGLKTKVKYVENNKDTDFQSQVNLGVEKATGDYVAIIEADDEINEHYVYNVNKHIEAYPEIEVFLPIVVESKPNGDFLTLTNESVWAMNLTEKIGYLDNETLKEYENYQISGMVINKKTYKEVGGLKKNIKLTFGYEFLLRLTEKGKVIYVIPKNIYRHVNMREGSLFWNYQQGVDKITPDEAKFWMETAKKEYFHKKDREITMEKTNV